VPGGLINVTGDYPFEDTLTISITGLGPNGAATYPVDVRIPAWATAATMTVNGNQIGVGGSAGSMFRIPSDGLTGSSITIVYNVNPSIRVETWYNGAVAVKRGSLVYSLQLEENFAVIADHGFGSLDYNITQSVNGSTPTIPWNAALILDPTAPDKYLSFTRSGPAPATPFSSSEQNVFITAQARVYNAWTYAADGSANPPPQSPVDCSPNGACGDVINVKLVPYGTTHLRMTQMPYLLP
jgi:hypothetical protein